MTTSVPVKMHLSPALARSTMSPRRITSKVRGIEPAGISVAFSCTRIFCQSTKVERLYVISFHAFRFGQLAFLHLTGSQYLNCCCTGSDSVPQTSHWKTPEMSSGRTYGDRRVACVSV